MSQNYNRTSSFNDGLAEDVGITAAIIFDELSFFSTKGARKDGWVYKGYEEMQERFSYLSEFQIRKAYKQLKEAGLIETKLMKVAGAPTLHYRILKNFRMDSEKIKESMDSEKTSDSIYTSTNTSTNKQDTLAFLNELIEIVNPKEKPTVDRERKLRGRLNDYSEDEVREAAKAFAQSEWHIENKQMTIDNLLAPSKFGRWYTTSIETKERVFV